MRQFIDWRNDMPRSWKLPKSMGRGLRAAAYLATAVGGMLLATAGAASAAGVSVNQYALLATIPVTGSPNAACTGAGKLAKFDISWTDARDSLYVLSDRTNCSLDVFDADTNTLLYQVSPPFAGQQASNNTSGPDGVLVVADRYAFVGDGGSQVKVIDLVARAQVGAAINTGFNGATGDTNRADEMVYDPRDNLVMVANDADTPPFVSFISTTPDSAGNFHVVGQIQILDACTSATSPTTCGGLEQSVWSPRSGLIYISVPTVGTLTTGEIAIINPRTRSIVGAFPVGCQPAGLAIGPHHEAIVGCSDNGVAPNGSNKGVQIIDLKNGAHITTIASVNGADEVWYNPTTDQYFVGAGSNTTTPTNTAAPELGIINAKNGTLFQTITTSVGDHSVAVDPVRAHVFLPDTTCNCIQVYNQLGQDLAAK
jgi:hypothetical protein